MSPYSPAMIERQMESYIQLLDLIDSLNRSLRYFYEYEGKDKAKHIIHLKKYLQNAEQSLLNTPRIKSIRTLSLESTKGTTYHISIMIAQLLKFFMVDKAITTEATKITSKLIIDEFPSLSLEEICICFNQAMKGHYGEDYNRLDGTTIMKWLQRYQKEKKERLSQQQYEKRAHYRAGNNNDCTIAVKDNQVKLREALLWRLKNLSI